MIDVGSRVVVHPSIIGTERSGEIVGISSQGIITSWIVLLDEPCFHCTGTPWRAITVFTSQLREIVVQKKDENVML